MKTAVDEFFAYVLEMYWHPNFITDTTGDELYEELVRKDLLESFLDELLSQINAPTITVKEFNRLTDFGVTSQEEMVHRLEDLLLEVEPERVPPWLLSDRIRDRVKEVLRELHRDRDLE